MSVPGGYFVPEEFLSPARFNRKTNTHLTGDEIASLSPTYPNQIVVCTATGGGGAFTQDTMYIRNSANNGWIGGSGGVHKHDAATDAAGGLFSEVIYANLAKILWINHPAPDKGDFREELSSGTVTKTQPALTLNSGSANGNYAHISKSGVGVSFSGNHRFLIRMFVNANTNLSVRTGVAAESVNDAPVSTVRRYGLEACDSASVPKNWELFTSTSGTRTADPTSIIVDSGSGSYRAYRLDYTVATNVRLFMDGAASPTYTKSTDVPGPGGTLNTRIVGAGVKTNTNSSRSMVISGLAFIGVPDTTAWG